MTTVIADKIRALVKRMHENSLQIQEANKPDTHFCTGWRGATNTYAIELLALVDREAAAQAEALNINIKLQNVARIDHMGGDAVAAVSVDGQEWPQCIDCGQPCPPDRDPLRCLVCQLDKDAAKPDDAEVARAWEKANAEIIGLKVPQ